MQMNLWTVSRRFSEITIKNTFEIKCYKLANFFLTNAEAETRCSQNIYWNFWANLGIICKNYILHIQEIFQIGEHIPSWNIEFRFKLRFCIFSMAAKLGAIYKWKSCRLKNLSFKDFKVLCVIDKVYSRCK